MTPIIAGRFEQETHARSAIEALRRQGFAADDIYAFFLNPGGQHAKFSLGGDRDASPGATEAHSGAMKGAAVGGAVGLGVGLAASALVGPLGPLAGAGAGAYAGSLVGAFTDMKDPTEAVSPSSPAVEQPRATTDAEADTEAARKDTAQASVRRSGMIVAVRATDYSQRIVAANVLRSSGAHDIERADGTWVDGTWTDFDPLKAPTLIDPAQPLEHVAPAR